MPLTAGRHIAIQRGAFDKPAVEPVKPRVTREPMVRCLDAHSLASLSELLGVTVQAFLERYANEE